MKTSTNSRTNPTRSFFFMIAVALLLTGGLAGRAAADPGDRDAERLAQEMNRMDAAASAGTLSAVQQEAFARNLSRALSTDHEGLQSGALRMIVRYGDDLTFSRTTVFDVVRIYRDHENERMRRMAVVALGEMDSAWAIDLLERSKRFEKSDCVRQTIYDVVRAYRQGEAAGA